MNPFFIRIKKYGLIVCLCAVCVGNGLQVWAEEAESVSPTTVVEPIKSIVVVLDPGHGGGDLGQRISPTLLEKDVTLKLAQDLKVLMSKDAGKAVWLTRVRDQDVSLVARQTLANAKHAQVFLSLHVADTRLTPPQSMVYTHRINKDNEHMNALVDQAKEKKLDVIPWERAQEAFVSSGERLAETLKQALETVHTEHGASPEVVALKLPLAGLTGVLAPAVMLEIPVPATLSGKPYDAYCRHVAEAVASGINEFLARR